MTHSLQVVPDPQTLAETLSGLLLINGELTPASSGSTFPVVNPATRRVVGNAASGNGDDVDRAVAVAVKAQPSWGALAARERGRLIQECGQRLALHVEEIGRLLALESGKALRTESRAEAAMIADVFTYFGGLASELKGETVPLHPDMLTLTMREPIGVVGAIVPWNVPLLLMALKIAPALVAGNAVVVKSAEETPFAALRVCQIVAQVLPAGVLNALSGFGPECGGPLVAHPKVGKVTFTGSVETGRIIYRAAAEKLIPVTLELGGKSPMIVMADADLERAVEGAIVGMRFTRQGQSCTASSRIYVHHTLHDAFVDRLRARVDRLVMGDPLDEKTDIGTIISQQQFERVREYVRIGQETPGAVAHQCASLPDDPRLADGFFFRPVIFTGLPRDHRLAREEIFGPVTCVFPFDDYDDVIEAANDSDYALAATVWTRDLRTALDAAKRLEAGLVQVNQNLVVQPQISYGGFKRSGLGKEGSLESMLEHFTHKKTVIVNLA